MTPPLTREEVERAIIETGMQGCILPPHRTLITAAKEMLSLRDDLAVTTGQLQESRRQLQVSEEIKTAEKKILVEEIEKHTATKNKLLALEQVNQAMRSVLTEIDEEHRKSFSEANDIGYSDGLYLKPKLRLKVTDALSHPTTSDGMERKV